MIVKLLTEHHLEVLSLKGGCTGTSESTLVKMPHCWKSHVTAHLFSYATRTIVPCRMNWLKKKVLTKHKETALLFQIRRAGNKRITLNVKRLISRQAP